MSEKLNPQIRTMNIGTKKLFEIKIYPLSFADQTKMTDLITQAVQKIFAERQGLEKAPNIEVVSVLVGLVKENIEKLLLLVTDDGKKVLESITNLQLFEIASIVYEMNYEAIAKNVKDLFGKIVIMSPKGLPKSPKKKGPQKKK